MTAKLNTTTLSGSTTQDADGSFGSSLAVGQARGSFSHIGSTEGVGVKGTLEVTGTTYLRDLNFSDAASDVDLKAGDNNALDFRGTKAGASERSYIGLNTNSGIVSHDKVRVFHSSSGVYNLSGTGTGTSLQMETLKYTYTADSGAAGILNQINETGSTLLWVDAYSDITAGGVSGGINVGITTSGVSATNLVNSQSAGTAATLKTTQGTNSAAVVWSAGGYLTASCSGGNISGFAGSIYLTVIRK